MFTITAVVTSLLSHAEAPAYLEPFVLLKPLQERDEPEDADSGEWNPPPVTSSLGIQPAPIPHK